MHLLTNEQFQTISQALQHMANVVENTFAHDEEGNRFDDCSGEEPEFSGADIFEQVCNIEPIVFEALRVVETIEDDSQREKDVNETTTNKEPSC